MLKLYDKVKIKKSNAICTIVNIQEKNKRKYYCIEYDEKY